MSFYLFPQAIPKTDCKKYLNHCLKTAKFKQGSIVKDGLSDIPEQNLISNNIKSTKLDHSLRKTSVSFITNKNDLMNDLVWGFIRHANNEFFNYQLSYFQPIQFAMYQSGEYYDWHQDAALLKTAPECRKLSLSISITDDELYEGGTLEFYNGGRMHYKEWKDSTSSIRTVGSVVVFDSRDWHRVTAVTKGVKYSIVCWTIGPNFV